MTLYTQFKTRNLPRHWFHLVDVSPWPLLTSFGALTLTVGAVMYFHSLRHGSQLLLLGLFTVITIATLWWRDVIREATFEGCHTTLVQRGLRYGMLLFILSEVMFFFAFFWAFFHSSLAPNIEIGAVWPPVGLSVFSPWGVPLANTLILLLSGATVTFAHFCILLTTTWSSFYLFGFKLLDPIKTYPFWILSSVALIITITLAVLFTLLQLFEYIEAPFNITDGIYGSTFFIATGFHGLHVIIGTLFLTVCLFRNILSHFNENHHFGFEAAAWYWHFVDVVWLFLFVSIYWWGGLA